MKKIYLPMLAAAFLVACSSTPEKKESADTTADAEKKTEAPKTCVYSYNDAETEVLWVAYKYTEKTGVKGVFDSVMVSGAAEGASPIDVLAGAQFSINTGSVNSGDPTRDPKIRETFFGSMINPGEIKGSVSSITGDDESGEATFKVMMNGEESEVKGAYTIENDVLEVEADITVEAWNAMTSLDALNTVCEDLHKGTDGKSILWPDVKLFISTKLNKACD